MYYNNILEKLLVKLTLKYLMVTAILKYCFRNSY